MRKKVLVFNPTPNEFAGVSRHLAAAEFQNLEVSARLTGPGKVNAAFGVAAEALALEAGGGKADFILGAGTAGSLSRSLKSGDLIVSAASVISDWQMVDDGRVSHAAYGELTYAPLTPNGLGDLRIECRAPLVAAFLDRLDERTFKKGALLSSDTFVSGLNHKLALGEKFQCLACDMESGVFGYLANRRLDGTPWFNVRVVADTLDETFADYANMEIDMVEILGRQLVAALKVLDGLV